MWGKASYLVVNDESLNAEAIYPLFYHRED